MINGSKMVADIGDGYTIERDEDGEWHIAVGCKIIELGNDESASEIAKDLSKLVTMWGRK